ncbi:uncharacterized protein LOC121384476 [Gigantopelta aegis]|uniref:uncharacterized protein LOC121384476 n=1 Tax=Gigantopelta aegis TaxID=1735272 RepID=UPI001B888EA3|nr:uncharacterized protein LOC121384476 [Gigantopelta aegis]
MSGKKNRRRSSLAPNRVSMVTVTDSRGPELHRLIDPDLPDEIRLAKLSSVCLEHTLQNMGMEDCPHFDWFKKTAQENIGSLISQLQEDGVFEQACQKDRLLPNPVNEDLDARIADAELSINGLESEKQKWDDISNELDEKVKQAELEKEKKEVHVSRLPDSVKIQSRDYYTPTSDYQVMVTDVQQHVNKAALSMEESCCSVNLLQTSHQKVSALLETGCNQLWKESFQDVGSPRQQLTSRLAVPDHSSDQHINGEM